MEVAVDAAILAELAKVSSRLCRPTNSFAKRTTFNRWRVTASVSSCSTASGRLTTARLLTNWRWSCIR